MHQSDSWTNQSGFVNRLNEFIERIPHKRMILFVNWISLHLSLMASCHKKLWIQNILNNIVQVVGPLLILSEAWKLFLIHCYCMEQKATNISSFVINRRKSLTGCGSVWEQVNDHKIFIFFKICSPLNNLTMFNIVINESVIMTAL